MELIGCADWIEHFLPGITAVFSGFIKGAIKKWKNLGQFDGRRPPRTDKVCLYLGIFTLKMGKLGWGLRVIDDSGISEKMRPPWVFKSIGLNFRNF